MFKKLTFASALFLLMGMATAQTFEIPINPKLEKLEDFEAYNNDIIGITDWLIKTPYKQDEGKRKMASAFLFQWISGHPNISVELNMEFMADSKKNPELMMIFMGGWSKYMIEHPEDVKDMKKGTIAGIRAMLQAYNGNIGAVKDKNMDKFSKLEKEGKLEEWVSENMPKKG